MQQGARTRTTWFLTAVAVVGLVVDAVVHLRLAGERDAVGTVITQGWLFRLEAGAAILALLGVLGLDSRWTWAAAGAVGLAGCAAVVLYTYVHVRSLGPLPDMYEPIWFPAKTLSLLAEAGIAAAWIGRELSGRLSRDGRWRRRPEEPVHRVEDGGRPFQHRLVPGARHEDPDGAGQQPGPGQRPARSERVTGAGQHERRP